MTDSEFFVVVQAMEHGKKEISKDDTSILNTSGLDLFLEIGVFIKNEMDNQVSIDYKNRQEQIVNVLYQRFRIKDFDETNSLESSLIKYIKDLKEKDLLEDISEIIEGLKRLRLERIQFWEKILEDYSTNKDYFDKIAYEQDKR